MLKSPILNQDNYKRYLPYFFKDVHYKEFFFHILPVLAY